MNKLQIDLDIIANIQRYKLGTQKFFDSIKEVSVDGLLFIGKTVLKIKQDLNILSMYFKNIAKIDLSLQTSDDTDIFS